MHLKPHLDIAHTAWRALVKSGDTVIDATCGNGHDTLLLAKLALADDRGQVIALDIQPQAIQQTQARLQAHLSSLQLARVRFIEGSHAQFAVDIAPTSVTLIVYNLGYLPGGNKAVTTQVETTLESANKALNLIKVGGLLSITCYPGHAAGAVEEQLLMTWSQQLGSRWKCEQYRWSERAPSLILLTRLS